MPDVVPDVLPPVFRLVPLFMLVSVPTMVLPGEMVVLVVVVVVESVVVLSLPLLVQLKTHIANTPQKSTRLIN